MLFISIGLRGLIVWGFDLQILMESSNLAST